MTKIYEASGYGKFVHCFTKMFFSSKKRALDYAKNALENGVVETYIIH